MKRTKSARRRAKPFADDDGSPRISRELGRLSCPSSGTSSSGPGNTLNDTVRKTSRKASPRDLRAMRGVGEHHRFVDGGGAGYQPVERISSGRLNAVGIFRTGDLSAPSARLTTSFRRPASGEQAFAFIVGIEDRQGAQPVVEGESATPWRLLLQGPAAAAVLRRRREGCRTGRPDPRRAFGSPHRLAASVSPAGGRSARRSRPMRVGPEDFAESASPRAAAISPAPTGRMRMSLGAVRGRRRGPSPR